MKRVQLRPDSRLWRWQFQKERLLLWLALGRRISAVHHVGSTAMPGMIAKPVIDIIAVAPDYPRAERCVDRISRTSGMPTRGRTLSCGTEQAADAASCSKCGFRLDLGGVARPTSEPLPETDEQVLVLAETEPLPLPERMEGLTGPAEPPPEETRQLLEQLRRNRSAEARLASKQVEGDVRPPGETCQAAMRRPSRST